MAGQSDFSSGPMNDFIQEELDLIFIRLPGFENYAAKKNPK